MSSSSPPGPTPVDDVPAPGDAAAAPGDTAAGTVLTRSDVAHLAHLARLSVTEEELDRYVGQLSVILESVAVVSEVVAGGAVATKWQAPASDGGANAAVAQRAGRTERSQSDPGARSGGSSDSPTRFASGRYPQSVAVTEVAKDDIEPTSHAVPLTNVYREDVVIPGLTREQALAMAPAAEDGRFRVPQILGDEQ